MASVGEALQRAVFRALRDDASLAALFVGGEARIFDRVPPPDSDDSLQANRRKPAFPYITIGDDELIDDGNGCARAWEATCTVHVWSRAVGKVEAKALADAVAYALGGAPEITSPPIAPNGFTVVDWAWRDTRTFTDPDGLTTHSVLTFRYLIDED
jgi:hypothetical protein